MALAGAALVSLSILVDMSITEMWAYWLTLGWYNPWFMVVSRKNSVSCGNDCKRWGSSEIASCNAAQDCGSCSCQTWRMVSGSVKLYWFQCCAAVLWRPSHLAVSAAFQFMHPSKNIVSGLSSVSSSGCELNGSWSELYWPLIPFADLMASLYVIF
jgi:hypothetical protein